VNEQIVALTGVRVKRHVAAEVVAGNSPQPKT
jgi:hypothetical protein